MAIRNSVRIIGGAWRGRRIRFPDIEGLRPTPDRVRETLFNWLQQDIVRARCLDLFAGSGALGLEALSRGAWEVVFVEQSPAAAKSIREHLKSFGGNGVLIESDVERYLAQPARVPDAAPFDLVFLDPPFGQNWLPRILAGLQSGAWIAPGGAAYLECERILGTPVLPPGWQMLRSKFAGEVGYHLARVHSRNTQ